MIKPHTSKKKRYLESSGKPEPTLKDRLTEEQAVREYRLSREGLFQFRNRRDDPLPHLRLGRRIIYIRGELEEWGRRQAERRQA